MLLGYFKQFVACSLSESTVIATDYHRKARKRLKSEVLFLLLSLGIFAWLLELSFVTQISIMENFS